MVARLYVMQSTEDNRINNKQVNHYITDMGVYFT